MAVGNFCSLSLECYSLGNGQGNSVGAQVRMRPCVRMNGINPGREQRQRKDVFTQWRPQSTTLPLHMALPWKVLGGSKWQNSTASVVSWYHGWAHNGWNTLRSWYTEQWIQYGHHLWEKEENCMSNARNRRVKNISVSFRTPTCTS